MTSCLVQLWTLPQCVQVNLCVFILAVRQRFSSIVLPVSVSFDVDGQRTSKLLMLGPVFGFGRRGGSKRNLVGMLVLCNRYGLPIAARTLGEFQGASEAPVSVAILAERATRKFAKRTAARRVELKMVRRLRCSSVIGPKGHAPSSRLGGGPF